MVESSWEENVTSALMIMLHRKMKNLKKSLKNFNKGRYGDISRKVKEKKKRIGKIASTQLIFYRRWFYRDREVISTGTP